MRLCQRPAEQLLLDRTSSHAEEHAARFVEGNAEARLAHGEGRVADHAILAACGVAGVARREERDVELPPSRQQQQAVQRRRAASLVVIQVGREARDPLDGLAVDRARFLIAMVVRQVRRDHHQRLRAAPKPLEDFGHLGGVRRTHRERHEREAPEHFLQERKLDFERMLQRVRVRAGGHLREPGEAAQRLLVDRDAPERRVECVRARQGEASHRHAMDRAEKHDALDDAARRPEVVICVRRHRAGIDVARVRDDQCLRKTEARLEVRDAAEQLV